MAQDAPARPKQPLDVLQSMLNAVLIETGRALKGSNKEGGKAQVGATRTQSTIPTIIEQFQQALDDLEIDILQSKSVLQRDLEECRSKRLALENPIPVAEKAPEPTPTPAPKPVSPTIAMNRAPSQSKTLQQPHQSPKPSKSPEIKKEPLNKSPESVRPVVKVPEPIPDPPKESIVTAPEPPKPASKPLQMPSPQASTQASGDNKIIGLGINTENTQNDPSNSAIQDSSIDSLFDIPNDNDDNIDMDFDNMDFSFAINSQDQTQTQSNDFDLSTFGNMSQDQNVTNNGTGATNISQDTSNNTNSNGNKQLTDSFDLDNVGGDDNMDLDLTMFGADDSVFDDMFVDGGGLSAGGGGEMEHGNFDNNFFGLEN